MNGLARYIDNYCAIIIIIGINVRLHIRWKIIKNKFCDSMSKENMNGVIYKKN